MSSHCFSRAAVIVYEDELANLTAILEHITSQRIHDMRKQVQFYWEHYFSSMQKITLTTLQIINDRVFPYAARKYEEWNDPPNKVFGIFVFCHISCHIVSMS